jgi:hypothetical protein
MKNKYLKYRLRNFKPYLKDIYNEDVSCGGHLVSMITGIPIKYVQNLHPDDSKGWSEEWVLAFLNLAGYSLLEIPKGFENSRNGFERFFYPDHLMVYLLGIDAKELTWAFAYKGKIYHGQNIFKGLNGCDVFTNCPIEKTWVCYQTRRVVRHRL